MSSACSPSRPWSILWVLLVLSLIGLIYQLVPRTTLKVPSVIDRDASAYSESVGTITLRGGNATDLNPKIYLGQMDRLEEKPFSVPVFNATNDVADIHVIGVSCGCLSLRSDPTRLLQGTQGEFKGYLNGTNRPAGLFTQTAICSISGISDTPATLQVAIAAAVRGCWAVPGTLNLTSANLNGTEEARLTLFLIGPGDLAKSDFAVDPSEIRAHSSGSLKVRREATIDRKIFEVVKSIDVLLDCKDCGSVSSGRGTLSVHVPDCSAPPLVVPIAISPDERIRPSPARGLVTKAHPSERAEFVFNLVQTSDDPPLTWSDVRATSDVPHVECILSPSSPSHAVLQAFVQTDKKITRGEIALKFRNSKVCVIPFLVICDDD